jgi:putative glutamine amidotransferase
MSLAVGIATCNRLLNGTEQHATPERYSVAVLQGADAVPVLLPPLGAVMLELLDRLDGLLFTGSGSNVAPHLYGETTDLTPDRHDPGRDATTLPLIRAALARDLPLLAICRGIQEFNVACGGTLHQQVENLPGRLDHRAGPGEPDWRYRPKHDVRLSGRLAEILGKTEATVNSSHEQAVDRPGKGLLVEAVASDGTIEALRAEGAGFALGVQWHPEWRYAENPDSVALFRAFGAACRARQAASRGCRAA